MNRDAEWLSDLLTELRSGEPLRSSRFVGGDLDRLDPRFGANTSRELAQEWFGTFQVNAPATERNVLRGPGGFEDQLRELLVGRPTGPFESAMDARYDSDAERVRAIAVAAVEAGLADPFPTVGRWRNFFGDVEEIVRLTLRTAIELALGIGPSDPAKPTGDPILPIEVFWTRPHPWFEGWVLGRDRRTSNDPSGPSCGSVTIVFATPSTGTAIAPDPAADCRHSRPADPSLAEEWRGPTGPPATALPVTDAPTSSGAVRPAHANRSMLRICHEHHVVLPPINSRRETGCGEWIVPEPGGAYVGVGPVRAVHRPAIAGGLNPYVEPTSSER